MSYLRRASPLHAARAGVGAAYCAAIVLASLVLADPLVLGVLAAAVLLAGIAAGVGGRVARSLYLSVPMALLIVVVNALVSRGGLTVIARLGDAGPLGQLDITLEAVAYGAKEALVLVVIIAACALASAAVDPDELLRSLRRVSFRSALTATIATRMVPLLAQDAQRIGEAQRCRPDPGGRLAVMRAITANVLDRSLDIAATLEVRGYGSARRPRRAHRPWSRHDLRVRLCGRCDCRFGDRTAGAVLVLPPDPRLARREHVAACRHAGRRRPCSVRAAPRHQTMNALELAGVSYTYPGSPAPALREVTLEIAQGEFVVLAGALGRRQVDAARVGQRPGPALSRRPLRRPRGDLRHGPARARAGSAGRCGRARSSRTPRRRS